MDPKRLHSIQMGVLLLALIWMGLMALGIFTKEGRDTGDQITANSIMFTTDDSVIVPGITADLPNDKEGTIIWWTKPEMSVFKEFKYTKEYLIMFVSKSVPGVIIAYNFPEENIQGGTPIMHTPKVVFFDDKPHQIGYTFKQGGLQSLYFDGNKLAETGFELLSLDSISGYVVKDITGFPKTLQGNIAKTEVFDRALTEAELKAMMT